MGAFRGILGLNRADSGLEWVEIGHDQDSARFHPIQIAKDCWRLDCGEEVRQSQGGDGCHGFRGQVCVWRKRLA